MPTPPARVVDASHPQIMGVLNVTPDSFSDGGLFLSPAAAVHRAREMVAEGATIIDVGGESTRPGASPVPLQEELDRVIPVIEAIHAALDVTISIDTSKPQVMAAAVAAGARLINDVRALCEEGAMRFAAESGVAVCLMHAQGAPRTMQQAPVYANVVEEVYGFLQQRVASCLKAGIARERLIVDPGFGFGKTLRHNLALARDLHRFQDLGLPILVGVSRKSMFGAILGAGVHQRLYGSLAMTALLLERGATIVRTHDIAATLDVIKVVSAVADDQSQLQQ